MYQLTRNIILSSLVSASTLFASIDVAANANQDFLGVENGKILSNSQKEIVSTQHAQQKILKVKTKDWGEKYATVATIFETTSRDRQNLKDLRAHFSNKFNEMVKNGETNFSDLTRESSASYKAYINNIFAEEVTKLGDAPGKFSIFTMGSLARQESGIITDLEIGYLIEENTIAMQKYLFKLSQRISDRLFLLGEHPKVGGKGFRLDEADNSPFHYVFTSRYADHQEILKTLRDAITDRKFDKIPFEGSRMMITTPELLASYNDPKFLKSLGNQTLSRKEMKSIQNQAVKKAFAIERTKEENSSKTDRELWIELRHWSDQIFKSYSAKEKQHIKNLNDLLRNIDLLYGNEELFNHYKALKEPILEGTPKNPNNPHYTTRREEIANKKLLDDIKKYQVEPDNLFINGKLGKTVDLKRQLYRLPEQILTDLGFYHNLGIQNTVDIAKALVDKGVMSANIAKEVQDLLNFVIGKNLQQQVILQKQNFAIYLDQDKFDDDKKELETNIKGLETYLKIEENAGTPRASLEDDYNKLLGMKKELKDFDHYAPGKILSDADVALINDKYLPMLCDLFQRAVNWVSGDKKAFYEGSLLSGNLQNSPSSRAH